MYKLVCVVLCVIGGGLMAGCGEVVLPPPPPMPTTTTAPMPTTTTTGDVVCMALDCPPLP